MTPLERLGLEVAAYTLIGSRAQASALCALLDANGRPVGWRHLARARPWRTSADAEEMTTKAMQVRICLLRNAVEDLGHPNAIVTQGQGVDLAYSLPEPGRSAIMARMIEEASTC